MTKLRHKFSLMSGRLGDFFFLSRRILNLQIGKGLKFNRKRQGEKKSHRKRTIERETKQRWGKEFILVEFEC